MGGHLRKTPARFADEARVIVQGKLRVEAPLQKNGGRALIGRALDLLHHLFEGEGISLLVPRPAVKRAEKTVGDADIGVVRIRVDEKGDPSPGVLALANPLRQ